MLLVGLATGCGATSVDESDLLRPAQTSIPKGTSDPRAKPAVETYESFTKALIQAQQKPLARPGSYPVAADFARYSFDPVLGEFEGALRKLSRMRGAARGTPPTSNVTVTSIDADGAPWPTVTLWDCQTGQEGWRVVDTATNRPLPAQTLTTPARSGKIVTVIYHQQRWGVNTIRTDPSRTCPAEQG